jgi:hypothetical protein
MCAISSMYSGFQQYAQITHSVDNFYVLYKDSILSLSRHDYIHHAVDLSTTASLNASASVQPEQLISNLLSTALYVF